MKLKPLHLQIYLDASQQVFCKNNYIVLLKFLKGHEEQTNKMFKRVCRILSEVNISFGNMESNLIIGSGSVDDVSEDIFSDNEQSNDDEKPGTNFYLLIGICLAIGIL